MNTRMDRRISLVCMLGIASGVASALPAYADFVPLNMPSKNYNEGRSNTAARGVAVVGYNATTLDGTPLTGVWNWQTDQVVECPLPLSEAGTISGLADAGGEFYGAGWTTPLSGHPHRAIAWQSNGGGPGAVVELPTGVPWATQSWATATNIGHTTVVGAVHGNQPGIGLTRQAAVWRDGGPAELLPTPVGAGYSEAWDLSDHGDVGVGYVAIKDQGQPSDQPKLKPANGTVAKGIIWQPSGITVVEPGVAGPDAEALILTAVSGGGELALATINSTRANTKGGLYRVGPGDFTLLDGGDINGDGQIDLLDDHDSSVNDLSSNGRVIGGSITMPGGAESAALWILGGNGEYVFFDVFTELSNLGSTGMDGWSLRAVTGVSADGTMISGWGIDPTGASGIWGATIPEPASLALLAAGLLRLRRR